MKKLRIFGSIVIVLIVTAFLTTPFFFTVIPVLNAVIWGTISMLIVAIGVNIFELFAIKTPHVVYVVFSILLLILSTYIFVFAPDYLIAGLNIPMSFWHRVSFYTLPAIAFESGIITLATMCISRLEYNEKKTKEAIVGIYAVVVMVVMVVMVVNFLAIFGVITVKFHVIISQIIITILTFFVMGLFFHRK